MSGKLKAGDTVELKDWGGVLIVGEPCDSEAGRWLCLTHAESMANNTQADRHEAAGCELAWWCVRHSTVEASG